MHNVPMWWATFKFKNSSFMCHDMWLSLVWKKAEMEKIEILYQGSCVVMISKLDFQSQESVIILFPSQDTSLTLVICNKSRDFFFKLSNWWWCLPMSHQSDYTLQDSSGNSQTNFMLSIINTSLCKWKNIQEKMDVNIRENLTVIF